eukprot:1467317-Pleurochrysis_carterae.AAC.1
MHSCLAFLTAAQKTYDSRETPVATFAEVATAFRFQVGTTPFHAVRNAACALPIAEQFRVAAA